MQLLLNELEKLKPMYLKKIDDNTVIAQIVVYDQFSEEFEYLIKKYDTTQSICGFTAIANAMIINEYGFKDGVNILKQNKQIRQQYIEKAMQYIQESRQLYIYKTQKLQKNKKEQINYMRDWVANYEISDYLKQQQIENIYFVRNVAWDHLKGMEKIQYEELERVSEELEFKGENYFIDHQGDFIHFYEFIPIATNIYVLDILGHFIVGIQQMVENKRLIILIETMGNNRLENQTIQSFFQINK